jgi:hypothetical protein
VTRDEALTILASGDFEPFIGAPESLEVEFKGEPYQVENESQKFELAKDVSALANTAGGVIVIGARTERDNQSAVDVVAELRPHTSGLVNEHQYEAIVGERVFPSLRQLQVRFFPSAADATRGLLAIDVPPQPEENKYFLVQRPIADGDDRTPGWLVGVAVRGIGRVEVRGIAEVHTLINRGLGIGRQLDDLTKGQAELRELIVGAPEPPETPASRLWAVIDARLGEVES